MKKLFIVKISVFLICGLFTSCDICKPSDPDPEIYLGTSSAQVNGELWECKTRASFSSGETNIINLTFDSFDNNDFLRQSFAISRTPLELNTNHSLNVFENSCVDLCTLFSTIIEGDIAGDTYHVNLSDTIADWIQFEEFDEATLEFKGIFQASFLRDTDLLKNDIFSDTLIFRNGLFSGKIVE